jgi:hypothetical protein
VHNHLIRTNKRAKGGIIIEAGDVWETHHFATLIGYGASAVNPYMAFETIKAMKEQGFVNKDLSYDKIVKMLLNVDLDKSSKNSNWLKRPLSKKQLQYAANGKTASEVIYFRVDSDKPFAGLTTFKGDEPTQAEALVAKNFLEEKELKVLNNLVAAYFDLAELNAIEEKEMRMADYIRELDNILSSTGRKILDGAGTISHNQAHDKAIEEYKKYKAKTLSAVEKDYLKTLDDLDKLAKKQNRKT